ncbi:hypothetical protein DI270_000515 [Microbispora triticiradicis]|uniref:Uncharacterized protein n=1 Tax=Microbispora triticiradicis TaxID=2200763 RepID=A0ABX9LSV2_9ACTN|nr:hypothetical protein [Microbispora triticiradicis]RGA06980.1 hypothetical protein DI270_000515 [Microbispora triticiradicis]GLW22924.1 hypothetical protein Mame01_29670 [Microbispora amethystogenes]
MNRTGYKRSSFKHWIDTDHDGCSTRAEVLLAEAVTPPQVGPGCTLTGGQRYSYYDDTTVDHASGLDVDRLVPLAEAWTRAPMPGRRRSARRTPTTSPSRTTWLR